MVNIITKQNNLDFFFECLNILMYEDDYAEGKYIGDFYRNKSENLIFNGHQIKSFEKVICQRDEEDGYMIVSTFDALKEKYNCKINSYTKNHLVMLLSVLKMLTNRYGICYSQKEIQKIELERKGNVEIIKSKWLSQYVKCSIENIKETCSIDLEEYDTIVKTKCGHYFSVENMYEWIRNNEKDSCPLCRTKIADTINQYVQNTF
jgi:hypothetical protein